MIRLIQLNYTCKARNNIDKKDDMFLERVIFFVKKGQYFGYEELFVRSCFLTICSRSSVIFSSKQSIKIRKIIKSGKGCNCKD